MILLTKPGTVQLSNAQRNHLSHAMSGLEYPLEGPYHAYLRATRQVVAQTLTVDQRLRLSTFARPGVVMVENLPIDAGVTAGPRDPEAAVKAKATDVSEGVLTGFIGLLGAPYGVIQEGRSLVSNVAAKQGRTQTLTGLGAIPLDLHVENAFGRTFPSDRAPAGLALIGVCKEPGRSPATPVADGRLALRRLGEDQVRQLAEPDFLIRRPQRWRGPGKAETRRTAVLVGTQDRPAFVIATYGDMIEARTPRAADALAAFKCALSEVTTDLIIEPGRMALIDNRTVLHGRRGYVPAFGEDGAPYRWLQRGFWTDSLANFGAWRSDDGHMVDASRPDEDA